MPIGTDRVPDNLDEPVEMVTHSLYPNVRIQPDIKLNEAQQAELRERARDGDMCRVAIHHGPGHQSTTECLVRGDHDQHQVTYGSYREYAEWTGIRDIFSGYFDDFNPDDISYVRDDWTLKRRRRLAEFRARK